MRIILICILASFVISGLLNPIGIISGPVSESLGISNSDAVALFSYFTFGVFGGYVLSFYIFDYVRLKMVVIVSYLLLAISITVLYFNNALLSYCLFFIGIFASLEVCAASTLASWTWTDKPRQTVLIAQDAMFNGGGIVFTALTTYLLTQTFHWASIYLVVGFVAMSIVLITISTEIKEVSANIADATKTTWNLGVIGVGFSVLLFMLAKISIFIWAPQYAAEVFGATMEQSGRLLTNIFTGAFIGSIAGTFIVSKIRIEYFLIGMLAIGATGLYLMISVTDLTKLMLTAYVVGASVGATFNGYMAFGLSLVKAPTHRHVAYILLTGGLGSSFAPLFSSKLVESGGGIQTVLLVCLGMQIAVLISVIFLAKFMRQSPDVE